MAIPVVVLPIHGLYLPKLLLWSMCTIRVEQCRRLCFFHKNLTIKRGNYSKSDLLCFLLIFGSFYLRGFLASFAFMTSCSFFYNINTVGDHETFDVLVENHYQGKGWLKLQVQHSANLKTDSSIYTYAVWRCQL